MAVTSTIKLKTDTTANWNASNRVLAYKEPGVEIRTDGSKAIKIGDGTTPWNRLPYASDSRTVALITDAVTYTDADNRGLSQSTILQRQRQAQANIGLVLTDTETGIKYNYSYEVTQGHLQITFHSIDE